MDAVPSLQNLIINIQPLKSEIADEHNIAVDMLRLDVIHPIVSGNKLFKLTYFLEEAKASLLKQLITFGGAYSNHLAATAFACCNAGLKSIGIVRGEKPEKLSHTLKFCLENKMHLEFISRSEYLLISTNNFTDELTKKFGSHILIPEGGFSKKGANGAALICNYYNLKNYSHVCCAIGTATTFAGLIKGSKKEMVLGFPVLKNLNDVEERLDYLNVLSKKYIIIPDYHFGGYAKRNTQLISFINSFFDKNEIPLDFVYTGKMMFGIYDLIDKNYFPQGSKILCIHTGGLQGNKSLPNRMLNF
jgi:1-aminocyclopropane-1-carboxylate deaminase/D-cysteine desulfhydrase-like pyridoxal-dependent ACC family enzyme